MSDIQQAQDELIDEFSFFDDWMDRYQHIIDMGKDLPTFPEGAQTEENKIKGCQSQVWMISEAAGDTLRFQAISDSAIVSGLIAILMRVYNERPARDILATPPDFIARLGLEEHLSPTRQNGLHAMLTSIMARAQLIAG